MKKILLVFFIAFTINTNAQIALEHMYDSASTYLFGTPAVDGQMMIIKFEVSGERYVKINRWGKVIDIYDMNHALVKTISLASMPLYSGSIGDILYLSEQLFDTNSKMEFLYTIDTAPPFTGIYNEDGVLLFSDTASPQIRVNIPVQQLPIYNTTVGTKMILSCKGNNLNNYKAKVFSLPGILSTGIQESNAALMQAQDNLGNLYPNPSNGKVTLKYDLPKDEHTGEIILFTQQGQEMKRYMVDDTFNNLLLDNTMLPAGTYFYQLQTTKGVAGSKKMIVIK